MKFETPGVDTSAVEVTTIGPQGFRLRIDGEEVTVSFADFPWFREVSPDDLRNVFRPHPHHLRWPALDIDLALESLRHPEHYPLVAEPSDRAS